MKLWLDDFRIPGPDWHHVKTAFEAMDLIRTGQVTEISLDYDLDDECNGAGVTNFIYKSARDDGLPRMKWHIHSENIQGRELMLRHMGYAERYWTENEMQET